MTHNKTEKQKPHTARKTANYAIGKSYSDLPLFDFGVSDTLPLSMDKQLEVQVDSEDVITRTPPLHVRSKAGISKSAPPKSSKAPPAIPQPAPRHTLSVPIEATSALLTVSDVCKLLKISRSTLIRMEKVSHIPGRLMLGGSVRYHRETIEAWLQDLAANRS